jgi:type I restriction enzyme S subunit
MNSKSPPPSSFIIHNSSFDVWSSAVKAKSSAGRGGGKKQEFYGIKKLRELILELAVRGLLIPQDKADEPATELLKKIAKEKEQLVKEGKLKRQAAPTPVEEQSWQYTIPKGWVWTRVGTIGNIFNGNSINARLKEEKYTDIEGHPFIATKDVGYGFEDLDYENGVAIPEGEEKFQIASKGAVLICAEGGSAGKKCGLADRDICFGNKLFANELFGGISSKYILSVYLSPTFFSAFSGAMTGIIGGISKAKFETLLCPLPPLAEQNRIVAKVDELMALCDKLEQEQADSARTHETLVTTLLDALTTTREPGQFAQAWQRIAAHFDTLFTTESSIDQLKQTILQLAVMGKLVEQDPGDEPAEELLKQIASEKKKLIKEGKIKKQKNLPEIPECKVRFRLPNGWKWCYLMDIAGFENGDRSSRYPTKEDFVDEGIPFFGAPDIKQGKLTYNPDLRFISEMKFSELSNGKLVDLDFVMLLRGSVGKVAQFHKNENHQTGFINAQMLIIRLIDKNCCSYLYNYMQSVYFKQSIAAEQSGAVIQQIPASKIASIEIPFPPSNEQRRIVAKVDELMALCDRLKANLQSAQATQLHLADSVGDQFGIRN